MLDGRDSPLLIEAQTQMPIVLISRGFPSRVRCTLDQWRGGECEECNGPRRVTNGGGSYVVKSAFCWGCGDGTGRTPGIGPRLAQAWPVVEVQMTDAIPVQVRDAAQVYKEWRWFRKGDGVSSPSDLPHEIFDRLTGGTLNKGRWCRYYDTEAAALAALSAALIAEARGWVIEGTK